MKYGIVTALILLSLATSTKAELVQCGNVDIEKISVQGARDDNHVHQNKLHVVWANGQCGEFKSGFVSNDNPAYDSMMSMVLFAKVQQKVVDVYVNTANISGSSPEIAIIHLPN